MPNMPLFATLRGSFWGDSVESVPRSQDTHRRWSLGELVLLATTTKAEAGSREAGWAQKKVSRLFCDNPNQLSWYTSYEKRHVVEEKELEKIDGTPMNPFDRPIKKSSRSPFSRIHSDSDLEAIGAVYLALERLQTARSAVAHEIRDNPFRYGRTQWGNQEEVALALVEFEKELAREDLHPGRLLKEKRMEIEFELTEAERMKDHLTSSD